MRLLLAAVTGQLLGGTIDVRKASAALAGLRELARLLERTEGSGSALPAGARPATPEEEAYFVEHDRAPDGVVLAIYALDVGAPAPAADQGDDGQDHGADAEPDADQDPGADGEPGDAEAQRPEPS